MSLMHFWSFVKAFFFGDEGPMALHSLNLPTSCQICPAYTVFFLLRSPHAQGSFLKYPSLDTKSSFPQFIFIIEIKELKLHWRNRSLRSSWNQKCQHFYSYREASYKIHGSMQILEHRWEKHFSQWNLWNRTSAEAGELITSTESLFFSKLSWC